MSNDRAFWAVVGLGALGTALGSYSCTLGSVESAPAFDLIARVTTAQGEANSDAATSQEAGEAGRDTPREHRRTRSEQEQSERRKALAAALREYIRTRRSQHASSSSGLARSTAARPKFVRSKHMPLGELSWRQYQAWAKYGNAVAGRDYKTAEQMLPHMKELFGSDAASLMVDTIVDDYGTYLDTIIEAQCNGHDPQSVWRKTMFMPFLLARLERTIDEANRKGAEARFRCGYAG